MIINKKLNEYKCLLETTYMRPFKCPKNTNVTPNGEQKNANVMSSVLLQLRGFELLSFLWVKGFYLHRGGADRVRGPKSLTYTCFLSNARIERYNNFEKQSLKKNIHYIYPS